MRVVDFLFDELRLEIGHEAVVLSQGHDRIVLNEMQWDEVVNKVLDMQLDLVLLEAQQKNKDKDS